MRFDTRKVCSHPTVQLSMRAANDIRDDYAAGDTQVALAERYGISQSLVSQVVRRKVWVAA